ncbi:MAG: nucleotide exchange factor GrpE [Halanaerobiales bacterium]
MVNNIRENEKESLTPDNEEELKTDSVENGTEDKFNEADDGQSVSNSRSEREENLSAENADAKDADEQGAAETTIDGEDYSEKGKDLNEIELLNTVAKLEDVIAKLEAEKEAVNNRIKRLQADFSNYRKRTDKEIGKVQSTVIVELIRELLPVIDNFERALAQDESENDFRKGVEMIYRQVMTFLDKQGVEIIEALGEEFDHNYHNAVAQVASEEYESGTVIEELQKGYILGDVVIRPAMVKVAE